LGKIDISFATPVVMNKHSESNIKSVTSQVQLLQRDNIMVSNYHIRAAASILGLDSIQIRRSLQHLQCNLWYDDKDTSLNYLEQPSSSSESWTVFLQFAHLYAPYLQKSHPEWAKWLNSNVACGSGDLSTESPDVMKVVGVLKTIFDDADTCVKEVTALLMNKGFSQPSHAHILQYVKVKYRLSSDLILRAAIILNHREEKTSSIDELSNKIGIEPLFQNVPYCRDIISNEENFGAWGYRDSRFVVSVEKSGAKTVQMKGNRYMISGRKMPKLIPFLEHETSISFDPHIISLSPNPTVSLSCTELSELSLLALYKSVSGDENRVTTIDQDRVRHGTGHSQQDMFIIRNNSVSARRMPDAVVYPKSENEVENIVNLAAQMNWCLIPFGGGTNVSHATWCPPKESDPRPMISMDMRLMDSILLLNEEDRTVHVQAGITGGNLIRELRAHGFTMGHEPDSLEFSTVGGWIATKASGMKQNRYGNIEDIVQNVHVISANGKLWQNGDCDTAGFARVSTGTDLTSLMLGSEGALGIITSAVLKVWPLPEVKEYESVILHSFDDGLRFLKDISKLGALKPASVRLLDNTQFRLGQSMASDDSLIDHFKRKFVDVIWTLIGNKFDTLSMVCVTIAFEGSLSEVKLQRGKVKSIATYHGGFCAGSKIGRAGYDMTFAIAYIRDFAMTHGFLAESFETFVPWSKVNSLINATKDRLRKEHNKRALPGQPIVTCRITQLYDQGVCVYFYFCMNFDNVQNPSSIFADIELAARQEILAQGGSLSHHHGIGKHRAQYMNQVNSASFKGVLMNFKTAVDPNNVFGVLNGSYANE
jgi:alkyldihydroxyacetonephosphate synthase